MRGAVQFAIVVIAIMQVKFDPQAMARTNF